MPNSRMADARKTKSWQMPCGIIPVAALWVASCGGGSCVRRTISATRSGGTGALPGGRDLSRRRPSTPSCMKRSCHRHTQVFDLPVAAMIAEVPKPSLLSKTIRARQTCFCGLKGAATMPIKRSRSASDREKVIPLRILTDSHVGKPLGIPKWTPLFRSIH